MKKIPNVFQRDWSGDPNLVVNEVVAGCEWVLAGEGVATRKWDGTAVLVKGGKIFKRYDAKKGKTPPPDFTPAQDPDPVTGHWPGWLPVSRENPADRWICEAVYTGADPDADRVLLDGTYEACGPKINGNPEKLARHYVLPHGVLSIPSVPRTFEGLRAFFAENVMEGIVFHHPDGRMAKVKTRDFGLRWPR